MAAGALFGDAMFHLLPQTVKETGFTATVSWYVLTGIMVAFVIEKVIHWTHCHHIHETKQKAKPFAMMNLFGDAIHNFIDGVIIGASYLLGIPVGIATTLAVLIHEIPQEIADFGVLLHGGFSKRRALFFNFLTALTSVIGAITALLSSRMADNLTNFFVPFAAGGFIYIAGADLIPELHKETNVKKSLLQFAAFAAGIGMMAVLLLLEN